MKLKPTLLAILTAAATTACSGFLDEDPRDQIAEQEAYTDAVSLYQNTVATLYNYIGGNADGQGLQGTCRGLYDLQTFASDEAMLPTRGSDWYDGGLWQAMYKHSWTAGHDLPKNAWMYLYKVIVLSNRSLETLAANSQLLSQAQLRAYTAEVRALRAMYYYHLMDLFGRVPLVLSSATPMSAVQQSERSQLFSFVYEELTEAAPLLSAENSVRPGDYYGRITRPVVYMLLAKMCLNAEVYTDDDWTDAVRPDGSSMALDVDGQPMNAWEATIAYCEKLRQLGFSLSPTLAENFAVYNENSAENIFTIPMDKNLYANQMQNLYRSYHYRHAAAYGFTAENGSCATLRALQVFGYGSGQADARLEQTYYSGAVTDLDGSPVLTRTGEPLTYVPWAVEMDLSGSPYVETAGARMKKYEVDKNAPKDGKLMDNDIVLYRYADALLMRAEAELRLGDDAAAQEHLDQVRRRAGMPAIEATLDNLLDERLRELAWEGHRRPDLVRHQRFKSLYNGNDQTYEADGHTTVFPIPADVRALNTNLRQNPGY